MWAALRQRGTVRIRDLIQNLDAAGKAGMVLCFGGDVQMYGVHATIGAVRTIP